MKNLFIFSLALLLQTSLIAQATRHLTTPYHQIAIAGNIEATITLHSSSSLELTQLDCDETLIISEVTDGTLHIHFDQKIKEQWSTNPHAKITINCKKGLKAIDSSAGATVQLADNITTDKITVTAKSGGNLNVPVQCKSLDATVSSGGIITLKGNAYKVKLTANSGGTINAEKLACKKVEVNASSRANISTWVSEILSGILSSGANIRYKGNARIDIDEHSYSSGNLTKIDSNKKVE